MLLLRQMFENDFEKKTIFAILTTYMVVCLQKVIRLHPFVNQVENCPIAWQTKL